MLLLWQRVSEARSVPEPTLYPYLLQLVSPARIPHPLSICFAVFSGMFLYFLYVFSFFFSVSGEAKPLEFACSISYPEQLSTYYFGFSPGFCAVFLAAPAPLQGTIVSHEVYSATLSLSAYAS